MFFIVENNLGLTTTEVNFSQVGKENVQTALSLVCYDSELHKAMEWVFGTSFICRDMDVAKRVTFDKNIMKKSVTLEGDVFDPAGTLTGGEIFRTFYRLCKKVRGLVIEDKNILSDCFIYLLCQLCDFKFLQFRR